MTRVEFIGASGSGKSKVLNDLLGTREKERTWLTPAEARVHLAKKKKLQFGKPDSRTVCLASLKAGLFRRRHGSFAQTVLRHNRRAAVYGRMSRFNDIIDFTLKSVANNADTEPYRKAVFLNYYIDLIINDILMIDEIGDERLIVYGDGIIHNSIGAGQQSQIDALVRRNPKLLNDVFPRAAVYFDISLEESIRRRRKRIKEGKGTSLDETIDNQRLIALSTQALKASRQTSELLERYGIPVLRIHAEADREENCLAVHGFLKELSEQLPLPEIVV